MNEKNYLITVVDRGDSCATTLNGSANDLLNAVASVVGGVFKAIANTHGKVIASQLMLMAYERGISAGAEQVGED